MYIYIYIYIIYNNYDDNNYDNNINNDRDNDNNNNNHNDDKCYYYDNGARSPDNPRGRARKPSESVSTAKKTLSRVPGFVTRSYVSVPLRRNPLL